MKEDPETENGLPKVKKNVRETWMRWAVLSMACNFYFGAYYCYDNFGPIETQIKEELDIDSA